MRESTQWTIITVTTIKPYQTQSKSETIIPRDHHSNIILKLQPFNSWKLPHHYITMEIDITTNNKTWPGQYRDLPIRYSQFVLCSQHNLIYSTPPNFIWLMFCSIESGCVIALLTSFILDIICHLSAQPSSTEFKDMPSLCSLHLY